MRYHILVLCILVAMSAFSQPKISYGDNPEAGRYVNVGDVQIYLEVYGKGRPLILLHGGLFGYIDEYENLIPALAKHFQVIAIATRGHGKSELGKKALSYTQFAKDTYEVIRQLTSDSVTVIGFSDGADQAYLLAATHPEAVNKIIAIGGALGARDAPQKNQESTKKLTAQKLEKDFPQFVSERKKLMPKPELFDQFVKELMLLWTEPVYISEEQIAMIHCPALIVAGQNDPVPIERFVSIFRLINRGQIAIIPGSGHLVLYEKPFLSNSVIMDFLGLP